MSKLQSFVSMPSEDLISRCQTMLDTIEKHRGWGIEAEITRLTAPIPPTFWQRLWGIVPKPPTREEVLAEAEEEEIGQIWWIKTQLYSGQENHVRRLMDLAQTSSVVNVTAEDLAFLQGRS